MVVSSSGGANYCTNVCQGLIFPTFYFIVFQVLASMMLINMFIGAIPGSMGETSALAALLGAAFLLVTGIVQISVGALWLLLASPKEKIFIGIN